MTKKVAVVGAGFSGVMSVYHLLNQLPDNKSDQNADLTKIIIFDKAEHVGGIAYGRHTDHVMVMNIPIDQMSAFESDPLHLFNWLQDLDKKDVPEALRSRYRGKLGKKDFCPRILYGYYLNAILEEAKKLAEKKGVKLVFENKVEVQKLDAKSDPVRITYKKLTDNVEQSCTFDKVILTTGNDLPFKQPKFISATVASNPNYIPSVWARDIAEKIRAIPLDQDICVVGTALSAMDVVLIRYDMIQQAIARGEQPTGRLILLSRHGLLHEPYSKGESFTEVEHLRNTRSVITSFSANASFQELKDEFEKLIAHSNKNAYSFRRIVESGGYLEFRELISNRYTKLKEQEVKILLNIILSASHLETLATGMPYSTGRKIAKMGALGLLEVVQPIGGILTEIESIDVLDNQFVIDIKNGEDKRSCECQVVINATGTNHDYSKTQALPYPSLYETQNVKNHLAGFDLATDEQGRMLDKNDKPSDSLYCIGPMRAAADAETRKPILSTNRSIVRLRQQVQETATAILHELPTATHATTMQQASSEEKLPMEGKKFRAETQFYSFYKAEDCHTDHDLVVEADIFCSDNNKITADTITLGSKFSYLNKDKVQAKKIEVSTEKMRIDGAEIKAGSMVVKAKKSKLTNSTIIFHNEDAIQNEAGKRRLELWSHEGEISKWQNVALFVEDFNLGAWSKETLLKSSAEPDKKHKLQIQAKYVHIDDKEVKVGTLLKIALHFYGEGEFVNAKAWLNKIDFAMLALEDKKRIEANQKLPKEKQVKVILLVDVYKQVERNLRRKMTVTNDDINLAKVQKMVCYKAYLSVDNEKIKTAVHIEDLNKTMLSLRRHSTFSERTESPKRCTNEPPRSPSKLQCTKTC